jgi:hypothetical protein
MPEGTVQEVAPVVVNIAEPTVTGGVFLFE